MAARTWQHVAARGTYWGGARARAGLRLGLTSHSSLMSSVMNLVPVLLKDSSSQPKKLSGKAQVPSVMVLQQRWNGEAEGEARLACGQNADACARVLRCMQPAAHGARVMITA